MKRSKTKAAAVPDVRQVGTIWLVTRVDEIRDVACQLRQASGEARSSMIELAMIGAAVRLDNAAARMAEAIDSPSTQVMKR